MNSLKIRQLRLRDYRCFESLDIDFHPRLTVLVASNGAGKTSILDALAVALGPYVGAFSEASGPTFEASDIRLSKARDSHTNEMEYAAQGVRLEATGHIPGSTLDAISDDHPDVSWKRALAAPTKAKTTNKDARELSSYGKRMQEAVRTPGTDVVLPLIGYYGTGRLWQQKYLVDADLSRSSRTIGYTNCLDPASSYKAFAAWFQYWSFNLKDLQFSDQGDSPAAKEFAGYIHAVTQAVESCLAPAGWKGLAYSFKLKALVASHDQHGELPVELLSDGIRNMIGLVADIAFRATKLNGQLGANAALQTPGIVLIDEVDMHLHPAWQQTVLASLQEAFPQVQFIVTTHSPQVLSTVSSAHIRVVTQHENGSHVAPQPDFSPLGHAAGDALAKVMGTHKVPPLDLLDDVHAYEQLVRSGLESGEEAVQLKAKLDRAGYQVHDSDLVTWRFLASRKAGKQG